MTAPLPRADDASIRHTAARWRARADLGLRSAEKEELDAWLGADPSHRTAFDRLESVVARFDRPARPGVADRLLQNLGRRARSRRRRNLAIGVVALALVGGAMLRLAPPPGQKAVFASAPILIRPDYRTLPDGSTVEHKAAAQIDVQFTPTQRRVVLTQGEAYFKVAVDPVRPFVVSARGVEARVLGTAFAVRLGEGGVEVVVAEGRVAVASALDSTAPSTRDPSGAVLAVLEAGKSVLIPTTNPAATPPVFTLAPAEMEERLSWLAPRVEFTLTPLSEAIAVLNGYALGKRAAAGSAPRFKIVDAELASIPVSGLFRVDRTDAFVALLDDGFGIKADQRPSGEILLRRKPENIFEKR